MNATELRRHRAEVWKRIEEAAGYEPGFHDVDREAEEVAAFVTAVAAALKAQPELRDEYLARVHTETVDKLSAALDGIAAAVADDFHR